MLGSRQVLLVLRMIAARKFRQVRVADVPEILVDPDLGRVIAIDGHLLESHKELAQI